MRRLLVLFALTALACTGGDEDSAIELLDTEREEGDPGTGCEVLEVGYDGANPPSIGDVWTVWPVCDGSPVFGAMVVQVDPTSCASVGEGEITWAESGACELMVQSGSQKAFLDVEVQ